MTPEETATIVRLVKSVFPQQPIDSTTYETWHLVIGHLDFTVAQAAVIAIAHSEKFCSAAGIIAEADRAQRRHAHPSERTVAEAIGASTDRELGAARTPPTAEYLTAKADWDRKQRERAKEIMFTDREAARRAGLWLSYKLSGKLPPALALSGPPAPRWMPLPGDPPELRAWLSRHAAQAEG
jgi:hypothetical protein